MQTVISKDGTRLATYCSGEGAPLVLVQGTGTAKPDAWPAFAALQERFRVYTFDRRGRGKSGDGPDYELAREAEDVAAVVDAAAMAAATAEARAVDEPVNLLGHSFGGLLALEAALLTNNVRKLVLYEPAIPPPGVPVFEEGFIEALEALRDAGDLERLLLAHYRSVGATEEMIAQLKASPAWQERLAAARTIPREHRTIEGYRLDVQRFQDLCTPTLLLRGSESPDFMVVGFEPLQGALPDCRVTIMAGQEHTAMYTAPTLFVDEVLAFLYGS